MTRSPKIYTHILGVEADVSVLKTRTLVCILYEVKRKIRYIIRHVLLDNRAL